MLKEPETMITESLEMVSNLKTLALSVDLVSLTWNRERGEWLCIVVADSQSVSGVGNAPDEAVRDCMLEVDRA